MMSRFFKAGAALFLLFSVFACERYPQDPHRTLERVMNDTLRVGIADSGPAISRAAVGSTLASYNGGNPVGREVDIVKGFANSINATIVWVPGRQEHLVSLLEEYEIDLAIGGFNKKSPLKKHFGLSKAYYTEKIKIGADQGVIIPEDPEDLEDKPVYVERASTALVAVKKKGAKPIVVEKIVPLSGSLVAAPEEELKRLQLDISDYDILTIDHIIAIPKGENALLERLDEYIFKHAR